MEVLGTQPPQIAKPRNRYVYYPGCSEVPESVAPNIRNRSFTIGVEANIETTQASGVLFSHGARFDGHALYIKDGKLKYVYNWVGMFEQIVESSESITPGHAVLSATFEREGNAMPAERTLTLHIGETKVGEGRIKTQPGKFSIAGERLNIGKDSGEPITDDYPGQLPWPFAGGTIQTSGRRCQRRAVRRSRPRGGDDLRPRLRSGPCAHPTAGFAVRLPVILEPSWKNSNRPGVPRCAYGSGCHSSSCGGYHCGYCRPTLRIHSVH
jgi:hypothetical protein